jgi:hypothetical protein
VTGAVRDGARPIYSQCYAQGRRKAVEQWASPQAHRRVALPPLSRHVLPGDLRISATRHASSHADAGAAASMSAHHPLLAPLCAQRGFSLSAIYAGLSDMISDRDVWAAALLMLKRFGNDAMLEAAVRADELLENGDMIGSETWHRILNAIERLQAKAPADGEGVH